MKWLMLILTMIGGWAMGVQAAVNGGLGKRIGALEATFASFGIGAAALFFAVLFFGKGSFLTISQVPKYQLLGGVLGAFYVGIMVMVVPKIGVSLAFFALITGQLMMGAAIDHFGWFGAPHHPLTMKKVISISLMLAGIYLFNHK